MADDEDAQAPPAEDLEIDEDDRLVVLFDGVCNLCSGFVQFLVPRDPEGRFAFASLQSDVATDLLAGHDVDPGALESIVLIEGDDVYRRSGAILRICYHLGGVYRLLWPFRIVPRRIRDWCYEFVANRRYRWFGKKDRCMVPEGDMAERFLE